jgi:hypothetical protein
VSAKRSHGLGSDGSATARLACILPVITAVALGCLQLFGASSFAQDAISTAAPEDDAPLNMGRDQWRERVAKRRARQFTLGHRGRPVFDTPSKADEERIATERVLNDDSFQRGDIVSTNKGLFVFKGQSDQERHESDFVPLPSR